MNNFTGEGFPSYPNMHLDEQVAYTATELSNEHLNYKMNQYGQFLQRENIMTRHRERADKLLGRFIFEAACREGVYDCVTAPEEVSHE